VDVLVVDRCVAVAKMGGCISSHGRFAGVLRTKSSDIIAPGPDMSSMDLDELIRAGIAEAQSATVARVKRERSLHLHRARALLMEALRRCGSQDPDLRMHLLAVLLKLGEDSRSLSGVPTNIPETQHNEGQTITSSNVPQPSGMQQLLGGLHTPMEQPDVLSGSVLAAEWPWRGTQRPLADLDGGWFEH